MDDDDNQAEVSSHINDFDDVEFTLSHARKKIFL